MTTDPEHADLAVADPLAPGNLCASDVARGVARLFHGLGEAVMCEVPLPNSRRADMLAIDSRGQITIVEIKVAKADLQNDAKWPDYLDYCDRFFWALDPVLDRSMLDGADYLPERSGIIIADRYGAEVLREAAVAKLAPARRKAETLRIARLAMHRMMMSQDPELATIHADG